MDMQEQAGLACGVEHVAPAVMLIDDDEHLRESIALLLQEHGYAVDCCADAVEALSHLQTGATPDLILLDLRMPRMDGWQFRVAQKREPKWASIPVVALSADVSPQAAAIDADAYLTKPVEGELLIETVEQLMRSLDRERLAARVRELDRLGSLGALAGGIAHEVNNPLSFIVGNLELAQRKASELEARLAGPDAFSMVGICQVLARAQRGAERIASVMRAVSMFASADTDSVLAIDLREVMESSLRVASNEIRHCARLERSYEMVPSVRGNPAKLGQVFLNLLLNAVHAINESEPGEHVIRVSIHSGPGRAAMASVSDTGRGIVPALQERIFDPFFSAEPSGTGMGLGLAVSREIVESMGGAIEVESELGKGSTFHVVLPSHRWPARAEAEPAAARASRRALRKARSRPRVLVVDDEPMMCDLLTALLSPEYEVVAFTCPRAALASMLQGAFDVILCDLMMPELTGMDVYERVSAARPELAQRIVFITGGAFTERARQFLAKTRRPQVRKPFRQEELVNAIEAQLAPKH